jgi:glycosyltransferase involved in cell wall biosynthesis
MPQFILIDHSIQDLTGHHYQYAQRVLEAAAQSGYTPILAANIHFKQQEPLPWRVFPVYRLGFWPRMATTTASRAAAGAVTRILSFLRLVHFRLFFSRWGFLWLIRNQPIGYVRWHPFDSAVSARMLGVAGAIFLPLRLFFSVLAKAVPFRSYFAELFGTIWNILKSTALHLLDLLSPTGALGAWRFARRKRSSFGEDTRRLFQQLNLGSADIVFIPTLAEPEMLALLYCFRKHRSSLQPSYHLLFRRNLYAGREPDFDRQEHALLPIRNAFLEFHSALSAEKVFFYTDTEELTAQYNRFKIFPFRTCPIPHTIPATEHQPPSRPLRVTYLGDAREEKGYQHLPAVVQDLWPEEVQSGIVSFVFQSNYNVTPGEAAAVVARNQLSAYPSTKVRLFKEAISSEQYRELLLSADIMLLPYREDLYYARSSGVLIEALAAGIPVVVPATSWLAKQFADPAYRYLADLEAHETTIAARRHHWVYARPQGNLEIVRSPKSLSFGGEDRKVYTWLTVPPDAAYLLLNFTFDRGAGEFVTCYVDQVDLQGNRAHFSREMRGPGYTERTAWLAVPIHRDAKRMWVSLRNSFSGSLITVYDTSVRFLSATTGMGALPTSAVGTVYSTNTSESISAALREVVRHFEHYRMTARSFSESVYQIHNAANVIQTLASAGEELPVAKSIGARNNG